MNALLKRRGRGCGALLLAGMAALLLAGCAMTPEQRIAAEKRAIADKPAPNRLYLPERQPEVGERAVFETTPGGARHEWVVAARSGDRYRIRFGWLPVAPEQAYLKDMGIAYDVDGQGLVRSAVLEDRAPPGAQPLRLAGAGEAGYVAQPTVLRLPVPEAVDTGRRRLRIDAVALQAVRAPDGERTEILYLSDEVPLGVARVVTIPAATVSVTDVVGWVGAARMAAGTGDPAQVPTLDASLAPRLAGAPGRVVSRLVED